MTGLTHLKTYLDTAQQRLQQLAEAGQLRTVRTVRTFADGTCETDGRRLIHFGGNDYLNLAHELAADPDYQQVALQQVGSTASALVCGRSPWHERLEQRLADFEMSEAALLFPTGYAANLGVIGGLVQSQDAVYCDRDNHASIIDAAQRSEGKFLVYRRDRLEDLEASLRKRRSSFRQVYLVTDGVYSMDGTAADLATLCDLAERFEAAVVVDEAHGTGVLGVHGRGACELHDVESRVLIRIGTLSKALGGHGGFAVGPSPMIQLLRNTARTQFFSTALPPCVCAAMVAALRIIQDEPERRSTLAELTAFTQEQLRQHQLQTVPNGKAPIVPILMPAHADVRQISAMLADRGFFLPGIRPPTVPRGTDRLRLSLSVVHRKDMIRAAVQSIADCLRETVVETRG
ncbi:MAG: 8-amino-7-oxononanoate synthase [Planctomycetaceae bacterium]